MLNLERKKKGLKDAFYHTPTSCRIINNHLFAYYYWSSSKLHQLLYCLIIKLSSFSTPQNKGVKLKKGQKISEAHLFVFNYSRKQTTKFV